MTDRVRTKRREETVCRIIESCRPEEYDRELSYSDDPFLYRHLSSLRRGLLGWFPWKEGQRVLEVGAGFGALTAPLLEAGVQVDAAEPDKIRSEAMKKRYETASNLRVLRQDILTLNTEEAYDGIILAEIPQPLRGREKELFCHCLSLLHDGGFLLAGYSNRFGLRRWCGACEEGEVPFSALEQENTGDGLYTKSQFSALLRDSGWEHLRWFYPFPNALFPQAVYTDKGFPSSGIGDRVSAADPGSDSCVLEEGRLYRALNQESLLPHLADDCIGLFRKAGDSAAVKAAGIERVSLSSDRGPSRGFAVLEYEDGHVEKKALFAEGRQALAEQVRNSALLQQRGLSVVSQRMEDVVMIMPRHEGGTLMENLHGLRDRETLFAVFDRLKECLLQSSPIVSPEKADLLSDWGVPAEQLAPILETGFVDMIPFNIFLSGETFCFFDQEFVLPDCPLGYILFRALTYSYEHVPSLSALADIEEMKARYGLTERWPVFQARERAFLAEVRNTERFRQIYGWSQCDRKKMLVRRQLMSVGPEEQELLERVHRIQKTMLDEIGRVCGLLGVRYFAIHGTLLGAVRHRGFIPWDDDVDLAMDREDYERFLQQAPGLLAPSLFLQTEDSDRSCYFGGYARLRDSNTTGMSYPEMLHPCNQGIWIDLFPLDFCSEDEKKRERQQREISRWQNVLYAKYYPPGTGPLSDLPAREQLACLQAARCVPGRVIRYRLKRLYHACAHSSKKAILVCLYGEKPNRNVYDAALFREAVLMPFAGGTIPVPAGYRQILEERYGKEYLQLPPPERRLRSHRMSWLDPDRAYSELDRGQILQILRERSLLAAAILPAACEQGEEPEEEHQKTEEGSRKCSTSGCEVPAPEMEEKPYRIGLVMGVFDLFHIGHLRLIQRAKEQCGYLRVGVLSDELVIKYKNKPPVISQKERMEILKALREVDEVVPINDTPDRLTEWKRRPFDCFFSGDDYRDHPYWIWEQQELKKLGADLVYFPYTELESTTKIRSRAQEPK